MRKNRPDAGFTLPLTIMLCLVLAILSMAVVTRVFVGIQRASSDKGRHTSLDAAQMGLTMAIDEISPGIERMSNAIWSSVATCGVYDASSSTVPYPPPTIAQPSWDGANAITEPVRDLSLFGNIRNWDAFADWRYDPTTDASNWAKGWQWVDPSSGTQYFDPTEIPPKLVTVGNEVTTGAYWYSQLDPAPPMHSILKVPASWRNQHEYPLGIFYQPVLRKVFTIPSDPKIRVAVYVRLSLQDYCGTYRAPTDDYSNEECDGYSMRHFLPDFGAFPSTVRVDGANYRRDNVVTFSVFAVTESTNLSRGVRIHQALNVPIGGAEYASGLVAGDTYFSPAILSVRQYTAFGSPLAWPYDSYSQPYFAPALDTPRGDSQLVAHQPITGQVYHASTDLAFDFRSVPATGSVVFLYETIQTADNRSVVFLIEQMREGYGTPGCGTYWRRRLIYEWGTPNASDLTTRWGTDYGVRVAFSSIATNGSEPYYVIDPYMHSKQFPSMLWWANRIQFAEAGLPVGYPFGSVASGYFAIGEPSNSVEDHFNVVAAAPLFDPQRLDSYRYPFSAQIAHPNDDATTTPLGVFRIDSSGSSVIGTDGNVVVWHTPPLLDRDGVNRLSENLPWQGPTVPYPGSGASVAYFCMTWPFRSESQFWKNSGGGRSLAYGAATRSVP